jgi:hypothetical protein
MQTEIKVEYMKKPLQLKRPILLGLCIIILPPVGLFLVWMKKNSRLIAKLLGSLAAIAFGIVHLYLFWGLSDMNGRHTPNHYL